MAFKPESLTDFFFSVTQINIFRHQWYLSQHVYNLSASCMCYYGVFQWETLKDDGTGYE